MLLLTDVLLHAQLQLLALHLLDLLVVELVPVAGAGILNVGDVVARVGADAPVDQHGAKFIHTLLVWGGKRERARQVRKRVRRRRNVNTLQLQ